MKKLHDYGSVRLEMVQAGGQDTVAIVTMDNPPVNAGSVRLRRDLLRAMKDVLATAGLHGVVLIGANANFVAGADIREFDEPPQEPHLPEIVAAIEDCPVPVIAAIDGAALGGGYELALACDARIASPRAVVGLPEVTLGLIPGAGGTQRLPRLIGVAQTIALVTSGRRLKAAEAAKLGMIDKVADGDLLASALDCLRELAGQKRILRQLAIADGSPNLIAEAEADALKKSKGAVAVAEAITAVKNSLSLSVDEALRKERMVSLELRTGPQSQALRHLFLAERAAAKLPEGVTARGIRKVGVIGAGRMGRGIAAAFANRGMHVRLAELDEGVLAAGLAAIREIAAGMAARGHVPSAGAVATRVTACDLAAMSDCDLIVEAITEDMDSKKRLFARLDDLARPDAILASNTSYLDIGEMASVATRPERVAGLHFFNPAHLMRLVEVVRTDRTAPETVATLISICRRLGKVPVVAKVGEGFIGNRIYSAYRQQCEFLLEEGSLPEDIDRSMRDFGMAMGPFAVFDLTGLDVAWATRKRLAPKRDPRARYVRVADQLCEAGRFGRSAGKGWYDYSTLPTGAPDPKVRALIEAASAEKGIARRNIEDDEIQARLLAAIVNEAAWVLAEGIAARPSDIDLVFVHGYGFPALKGGPVHFAARQSHDGFVENVGAMVSASGHGFKRAPNLEAVLSAAEAI